MRILLLTNVFPSPWHPTKGTFNFELARALGRKNEVEVIAPIAWVDDWQLRRRAPPDIRRTRRESRGGLSLHYPRFFYTPKLGRGWYHHFLWRSLQFTLRDVTARFRPEAVLGYWTHPDGTVAVRFARQIGARALVMVGGSDVLIHGRAARGGIISQTLRAADGVLAVSADLRENVVRLGVSPERAHVIYRGVDRERFQPGDAAAARAQCGLSPDTPLFLWVGRMVPVKGLEVLLEAAGRLQAQGARFQLALVGDGPERGRLEQLARQWGLAECVRFPGQAPHGDLPRWYRAAHRTLLTSHSEGVPNVLLESHACGVPFIATRVGGVAEIAIDGLDRLVAPGDAAGLAEEMARSLAAPPVDAALIADRVGGLDAAADAIERLLAPPPAPERFAPPSTSPAIATVA